MGWIPLHDTVFADDWINELCEAERWAYFSFVLYGRSHTPRWRITKCSIKNLSRIMNISEDVLKSMLSKAVSDSKIIETEKEWFVQNGRKYEYDDTSAERQARYRARVKSVKSGNIDRTAIWLRDNKKCSYCQCDLNLEDMELDHIIPVSRGGEHSEENVCCSCSSCNKKKSNKISQQVRGIVTEDVTRNGSVTSNGDITRQDITGHRDTPNGVSNARAALASSFVSVWNLEKLDSWPVINFETMKAGPKKTLTDRLWTASKNEDFDLKQILNSAKESHFLQTGRFFTLLWLVSLSTKYNELNYKQVLNGTYTNSFSGNTPKKRAEYLGAGGSKASF